MVHLYVIGANFRLVFVVKRSQYLTVARLGLHILVDEIELELQPDGALIDELGLLQVAIEELEIVNQALAVARALARRIGLGTDCITHAGQV